jgi:Protein of unknown function (DUF2946)
MWAFALLPAVSRAMSFAGVAGNWAEICTPEGARRVALEEGGAGSQALPSLDHCAFCAFGADGAAPLPPARVQMLLPIAGDELPRLFLQSPRPLFAWRRAQPRAPPARA